MYNYSQVISATNRGNLVAWQPAGTLPPGITSTYKLKPTKLLRLEDENIGVLVERDGYVVAGNSMGKITFYDDNLQVIKWTQNFIIGPISSISFRVEDEHFERKNEIILGDFVVSSSASICSYIEYATGKEYIIVFWKLRLIPLSLTLHM